MIESPYLPDMISQNAFDTIYHEHVFYLSLKPMKKIFNFMTWKSQMLKEIKCTGGR